MHADNLFVRMLMLRERRAGIDIDPRMRDAVAVDQAGPQARKDLAHR